MRPVQVRVTKNIVGNSLIYPYARNMQAAPLPIYEVPLYELLVEPNSSFKIVRFGLTPLSPPPATRTCNVGLSSFRLVHPIWIAGYSPHSFRGIGRPGAWRILPGRQYLLHEGSNAAEGTVGGSLGCIEVAGASEWNSFLSALENRAGANCARISVAKALTLVLEAASYPQARLIRVISQ